VPRAPFITAICPQNFKGKGPKGPLQIERGISAVETTSILKIASDRSHEKKGKKTPANWAPHCARITTKSLAFRPLRDGEKREIGGKKRYGGKRKKTTKAGKGEMHKRKMVPNARKGTAAPGRDKPKIYGSSVEKRKRLPGRKKGGGGNLLATRGEKIKIVDPRRWQDG